MFKLERAIILEGETHRFSYSAGYRALILMSGKLDKDIKERQSTEVPMDGVLEVTALQESFITLMRYSK